MGISWGRGQHWTSALHSCIREQSCWLGGGWHQKRMQISVNITQQSQGLHCGVWAGRTVGLLSKRSPLQVILGRTMM